jgi:hypothetical protein
MGIAVIYAAYLAISIGLTIVVAAALSRSGRVFLAAVFVEDGGMAEAVNRMLVVGFYLLSLGYVALTVRTPGQIHGAGQAIGVLSVKVGEELLVLGALYVLNIALFARFRRHREERGYQRVAPGTGGYRFAAAEADGYPQAREEAGEHRPTISEKGELQNVGSATGSYLPASPGARSHEASRGREAIH